MLADTSSAESRLASLEAIAPRLLALEALAPRVASLEAALTDTLSRRLPFLEIVFDNLPNNKGSNFGGGGRKATFDLKRSRELFRELQYNLLQYFAEVSDIGVSLISACESFAGDPERVR